MKKAKAEAAFRPPTLLLFAFLFLSYVAAHVNCGRAWGAAAVGACRAMEGATRGTQERLLPSPAAAARPASATSFKPLGRHEGLRRSPGYRLRLMVKLPKIGDCRWPSNSLVL